MATLTVLRVNRVECFIVYKKGWLNTLAFSGSWCSYIEKLNVLKDEAEYDQFCVPFHGNGLITALSPLLAHNVDLLNSSQARDNSLITTASIAADLIKSGS